MDNPNYTFATIGLIIAVAITVTVLIIVEVVKQKKLLKKLSQVQCYTGCAYRYYYHKRAKKYILVVAGCVVQPSKKREIIDLAKFTLPHTAFTAAPFTLGYDEPSERFYLQDLRGVKHWGEHTQVDA